MQYLFNVPNKHSYIEETFYWNAIQRWINLFNVCKKYLSTSLLPNKHN